MISYASLSKPLKASAGFVLSFCIATTAITAQAEVSQAPLLLGGGSVPGNLALVPSVEWPTILSMANLGDYTANTQYTGYFDSGKCYQYSDDTTNADNRNSHFYPTGTATDRACSGNLWSGNYLNWAATQTIDPFRSALSGGYRVRDTATETWLEKARHTGQSNTGGLTLSSSTAIAGATPADWSAFKTHIAGLGNRMRFTGTGTLPGTTVTDYASSTNLNATGADANVYEVYIRVKVCDSSVGLEANCKRYSQSHKPEGLIQQYATDIRYSVFGYLNDEAETDQQLRDGGVLRTQQKFVGPTTRTPGTAGTQDNAAKEWNTDTGVFIQNPNAADATATNAGINDSGVINYLNKFGQMTTRSHKSFDPTSELYYTALRYFKNQGNVSTYSNMSGDAAAKYLLADGFPVITSWSDPIQYACQKNVVLGIGDVNTHRDKNLPGNSRSDGEPAVPAEVTADTSINVATATQRVATIEGITINTPFTGRENSAYIAGMAYDAHTKDQRSSLAGKQTVSTHWVDVRENLVLKPKAENQYWLAAKYGGFKVPDNYGDPYARATALPEAWWRTTTDTLETGDPRPDNFYVASDATKMVESLKLAFAQIANEVESTTASLATNSTRLGTDTAVFQSLLDSRRWSGDLLAKRVGTDGVVAETSAWSAASELDALTTSQLDNRNILTINPLVEDSANGPLRSTTGSTFTWAGLTAAQRALLGKTGEADNTNAVNRLAFLRGDRRLEASVDNRNNPFRQRSSRLGDIVNSDPQLIHKQDFGYSRLSWNDGAVGEAYTTFRNSTAYQSRKPLLLVGANDGMLHGFDARISNTASSNGGKELFAYVPNAVIPNLIHLTDPNYAHRYYVDGTPRVSDVWLGSSWSTMVVGSTGAGGKSIFALDITNPDGMNSSSVKWEFSHPKMGYTLGQPSLVALPTGKFGVIVSSGYHDTAPADGRVWILDAADGTVLQEFTLPTTGGLGGPLASDTDYDQVADRVYVGDTLGNLWRLDLGGSNMSQWGIPNSLGSNPLFIAKDASGNRQAITAPLSSAFDTQNRHMVYFGTGSFYRNGDNEIPLSPLVDTFYGIIDGGSLINGRTTLLQQKILKEAVTSATKGLKGRAITQNALTTQPGWYLDLAWQSAEGGPGALGERVVARATLRNDRVIFTTMTPNPDPCASGGTSWIMSVNRSSGARLNYVYFDTDGDGDIDNDDTTTITEGGDNVPWSGLSDADEGVTKGVIGLYKWLCFAGSKGAAPTCIPVAGSQTDGRKSWREIRTN